jgi:DnaJ domain
MQNALGKWSAQFQKQAAAFSAAVIDPPTGPEMESAPPAAKPEAPVTPDAEAHNAPQQEPASAENACNPQAETAGPSGHTKGEGFTHGPSPDEQQKARDQANEQFKQRPTFVDYYEVLQISRNADPETIHRVYRIMAARFHPDNPRTGDTERFQLLRKAYHVLSDPGRRGDYDRSYTWTETHTMPIFELKEFVDGIDAEKNRRLGVLSLLYHRRRLSEVQPGISVLDLEQRMGLPREYLNFTMWYLKARGFVRFEDNSDYGLTVDGVDYLEANSVQNTIIRDLLEAGTKGESGASTGPRPESDVN